MFCALKNGFHIFEINLFHDILYGVRHGPVPFAPRKQAAQIRNYMRCMPAIASGPLRRVHDIFFGINRVGTNGTNVKFTGTRIVTMRPGIFISPWERAVGRPEAWPAILLFLFSY